MSSTLILIDHVNFTVKDRQKSNWFYTKTEGCYENRKRTLDQSLQMYCGRNTEVHLRNNSSNSKSFPFPGRIHIAFDNISPENVTSSVDPDGNLFFNREGTPEEKMTLHPYQYSNKRENVALGIATVELFCPKGTAIDILQFYHEIFDIRGMLLKDPKTNLCTVTFESKYNQKLVFVEQENFDAQFEGENPPHVAIYVENIKHLFLRAMERNLAYVNGRFKSLDGPTVSMENLEKFNQFRIKDIVNREGKVVYVIEQEIRGIGHSKFPGYPIMKSNM